MTVLIEAVGVTRRFRSGSSTVTAVDDVSLTIRAGESIGLVGPSGSGKSTLVNLVLGWELPDDGRVTSSLPVGDDWASVAVVPQEFGLVDELDVRENVALAARLSRTTRAARDAAIDVDAVLASLDLSALARRRPGELSLGERQRVAVARAVSCAPRLLVADEPTAHQDRARADLVMSALAAVVRSGGGVLVATHDDRLLEAVDRVVTLVDGRVVPSSGGPPA